MFSKEKASEKIGTLIKRIDELKEIKRGSVQFKKWIRDTQVALEHIFGKESRHITDFNQIRYSLYVVSSSTPEYEFQQRYVEGLENAKQVLVSMPTRQFRLSTMGSYERSASLRARDPKCFWTCASLNGLLSHWVGMRQPSHPIFRYTDQCGFRKEESRLSPLQNPYGRCIQSFSTFTSRSGR